MLFEAPQAAERLFEELCFLVTSGAEVFLDTGFLLFEAVEDVLEELELFFVEVAGFVGAGFSGPAFSLASACAFSFGSACMLATSTGRA